MKKRLRKKRRLGEFKEFGFSVGFRYSNELDRKAEDELIDRFIEKAIEDNGLGFGGGGCNPEWRGFVVAEKTRNSTSKHHQEAVEQWFIQDSEILEYYVTPMVDAWHGSYDDEDIQWVHKKKA
ncbi:50S ribosome-binding protein YggL [Maridesulfovibrio frigidus]|uniref:50S ribosome-binding protein YggL n=1 Tax=Maridesulfovibrio frigidus TaxID=340956 RepID=UPI0004E14795|nr:50S ribosome-binding protein YggL [Maridesulfovibrio frigidus]